MARLNAVGINVFAGGFTLGVQRVFRVLAQLEECTAGAKTWDLNFDATKIERPLDYIDWPVSEFAASDINLVYANPPCAPWSAGNTRKGMGIADRLADPRLSMTRRTMETALKIEPDVFVLESVARAYSQGHGYYEEWSKKFIERGYGVTFYLTDALLCGVPSTRARFHFVASRHVLDFKKPDMHTFMPTTVRMAISDLEHEFGHLTHHARCEIKPELRRLMAACEQGQELSDAIPACRNYSGPRYSFMVRRLVYDAVGYTVVKLDEMAHPNGERWLTWREGLRLMGYPDDFEVVKPTCPTQAVMPDVGEHVARIAADGIRAGQKAAATLSVVDDRPLAKPYLPGRVREALRENLW